MIENAVLPLEGEIFADMFLLGEFAVCFKMATGEADHREREIEMHSLLPRDWFEM